MMGTSSLICKEGSTFDAMVNCAPLQDYINDADWPKVQFIKIDVEGAEPAVLKTLLRSSHLFRDDLEDLDGKRRR